MQSKDLQRALRAVATPERKTANERYFKSGKGEYGEGDQFLGVTVPDTHRAVKAFYNLSLPQTRKVLASPWHEDRLAALFVLVHQFERGDSKTRKAIYQLYLSSIAARVNNWDLVDSSAPEIVGGYTEHGSKSDLIKLARSKNVWERRVAMVATLQFISHGDVHETFRLADLLLQDQHDLIHKAAGWMLREAGKKAGQKVLETYLRPRHKKMPRTMLRYAIERFPESTRQRYLAK